MATNQKPTTKSTVQKDHTEKIEGLQEAAKLEDQGIIPGTSPGVPPAPPSGKGEKRLFQVGPNPEDKIWLTEAEAKKHGKFWRPDPATPQKK